MRAFKLKILWILALLVYALGTPLLGYEVVFKGPAPHKTVISKIKRLAFQTMPTLSDSITVLLENEGYIAADIAVTHDTIIIISGGQFTLGKISATIVQSDGSIIGRQYPEFLGQFATRSYIGNIKESIIEDFQDDGYYFASLSVDSVEYSDRGLNLELRVITGPAVIIARTRFRGLKRTNARFLEKICAIDDHSPLIGKKIEKAVRRISALPYLELDSLPRIIPNENYDAVELVFNLNELKANSIEFGGGYLPKQGEKPSQIVGHFHFQSANLFGHGREVNLLLDRKDRESSQIRFSYIQPLFIPDHLRLGLHLEQADYDSSYYSFSAGVSAAMISGGNNEIGGALDWSRIKPQILPGESSRTLSGKIFYNFSDFDYRFNPSRGHGARFSAAYLRRSANADSVSTVLIDNESIFEVGWDQYLPISRLVQLRVNGSGRVRITPRELIDFSEQFKLGGSQSLRGYREEQFAGRRVGLLQTEFRMRPSRFFAGYIFTDFGYIYTVTQPAPGQITSDDFSRIGYGAGIYAGATNARVKLEFGWGEGDGFAEGKLHVIFGALF